MAASRAPHRPAPSTLASIIVVLSTVVTAGVMATGAAAGPLEDRLAATNSEVRSAKSEIKRIDRREAELEKRVAEYTARIRTLDVPIASQTAQIADLETRIANRQRRIAELKREYVVQAHEIRRLGDEMGRARRRLSERLVTAYKQGDPGLASWLVGVSSVEELISRREAVEQVATNESTIVGRIREIETRVRVQRARNNEIQRSLREEVAGIDADIAEIAAARAELQRRRDAVADARARRATAMRQLAARSEKLDQHIDQLEEDSAALREAIRTGHVTFNGVGGSGLSSSGMMWPVSGPVVSPFGWRWGRMHEGVDIAVGTGVPIHAAATGVVTYAGWMSGYGNLVLIQHSGNLVTAYGHQSRLGSSVGQIVQQGQVIGFVGCTGHCFGPHVHFETRVNGSAVDPMQYL